MVNLGAGLPAWIAVTGKLLCGLSPDERARIGGGNAREIYRR